MNDVKTSLSSDVLRSRLYRETKMKISKEQQIDANRAYLRPGIGAESSANAAWPLPKFGMLNFVLLATICHDLGASLVPAMHVGQGSKLKGECGHGNANTDKTATEPDH